MIIPDFPTFAIGIPTLNRWDLLMPTLHLYLADFPSIKIYVLDNGNQPCDVIHPNIEYIKEPENIGVAASWNKLAKRIFADGHPFSLIMNDDIYLGKKEHDIQNLLHYHGNGKLFVTLKDFCVFLLPKTTFECIGEFDENFKCYYEDSDYNYRLQLKHFKPLRWGALTPIVYRENSTGDKKPEVHKWSLQSKQYYLKKWGGMPGQEKYFYPFDKKPAKS